MFTAQLLVWLALGGLLRLFGFGKWMIPAADWLVPLFLLRFSRRERPLPGALGIWLVLWIAVSIANRDILPLPGAAYFGITSLIAASFTLPYVADRLITPRLPGFVATLVFPLAWVTMELVVSRTNPYGTWGAVAYTQYGNLPLMQLASVTGIAGIAFLVTWFGSVVNWAWTANFNWMTVRTGVLIYAGVWSLVMLGGGARLALAPSNVETIRVAVVGWPDHIVEESEMLRSLELESRLPVEEREEFARRYEQLQDWFLDNTQREVRAGAIMVVWPELNLMVYAEDEAAFMQRAEEVARQEQVYLLMGVASLHIGEALPVYNKAVFVNPSGEVAFTYIKNRRVPGIDAVYATPGDGRIRTADTPYGRIASVICYDMDFPDLIQQVGRAGSDMLLVPASDWQTLGLVHFRMAVFRAIENGVSMVRATRWGVSGAVDRYGRTLATMDDFSTEPPVMVAQVPVSGVRTIYARIGDLFAWLCAAGLLVAIVWAVFRPANLDKEI